jgi:hypothetical protein
MASDRVLEGSFNSPVEAGVTADEEVDFAAVAGLRTKVELGVAAAYRYAVEKGLGRSVCKAFLKFLLCG